MMSDWKVELLDDSNTADFYVTFYGPKESPYEGTTL
jgi:ubiquitin-protein ligase